MGVGGGTPTNLAQGGAILSQVALAYVRGEHVTGIFMDSLVQNVLLDEQNRALIADVNSVRATILPPGRNEQVCWFLGRWFHLDDADAPQWLWFLDTDMQPATYTLPDMLEAVAPLGPCVASAATKGLIDGPVLTWLVRDENGEAHHELDADQPVTQIEACGMACTLIHREVLRAVEREHEDDPWTWFGHDLVGGARLSEDYTFCRRARAAGYPIYGVDTPVRHHKLLPI